MKKQFRLLKKFYECFITKNIDIFKRHKTIKKIYRISTHTGIVDVSEDHSLLNSNNAPFESLTSTSRYVKLFNNPSK